MQKRRTKAITLRVSPKRVLLVRLRRFRVSTSQRSKKQYQVVVNTNLGGVRQIAVEVIPLSQRTKYRQPRSRHLKDYASWAFVVAGLAGVAFFGLQLLKTPHLQAESPTPIATISKQATESVPYSLAKSEPTSVQAPRVGIDVPVTAVGRNADGSMATPGVFDQVTGWYKFGPTPGEIGPAVIVGHVDSYKGPSVFWRLRELQAGDDISVTRADGSTARFKVESTGQFDQDAFPTETIYGNILYAGLRLITCSGTFDAKTGHYSQNTVVFARLQKS